MRFSSLRLRIARRVFVVLLIVVTATAGRHAIAQALGQHAHATVTPATTPGTTQSAPPIAQAPTGAGSTAHLDPMLARQVQRAITAAAAQGVELHITSGWRSRAEQEQLYEQAIQKYGSPEEASHWVLPPDKSAHVKGEAVDVGPRAGAQWLEDNGVHFGLCRRYDNEWWHFELLAEAKGSTCPAREPYAGG